MVFLAVKMRKDRDLKEYKLIFLTDRTQLDQQLSATFSNTQSQTIEHARSVKELINYIKKILPILF